MKHAASIDWTPIVRREPKHSTGWTRWAEYRECQTPGNGNAGRHAKPFAAHHPARPVTYDATGRTTPLNPPALALDVAA